MDPFVLDQVQAPPSLAGIVETVWTARGRVTYGRERILPTTAAILIVNLGGPFRIRSSASYAAHDRGSRRQRALRARHLRRVTNVQDEPGRLPDARR